MRKFWKELTLKGLVAVTFTGCKAREDIHNFLAGATDELGDTVAEVTNDGIVGVTQMMTGDFSLDTPSDNAESVEQVNAPYGYILGYTFTEEAVALNEFIAVTGVYAVDTEANSQFVQFRDGDTGFTVNLFGNSECENASIESLSEYGIYGYEIWEDSVSFEDIGVYFGNVKLCKGCLNSLINYYGEPSDIKTYLAKDDTIIKEYGWCSEHSDTPNLWFFVNGADEIYGVKFMIPLSTIN